MSSMIEQEDFKDIRVLKYYVSKSHPDYKIAREQSNESRRLFNTFNKVEYEKLDKRVDSTKQTPVSNSMNIDVMNDSLEVKRKKIMKSLHIKLPVKVAQSLRNSFKQSWDTVIRNRTQGKKSGNVKYRDKYSQVIYNKQAISRRKGLRKIIPTGWVTGVELPDHVELSQVLTIKLNPTPDGFILLVAYEIIKAEPLETGFTAAGDLGVDSLITIVINDGSRPKRVDGRVIKSKNRYYNKVASRAQRKRAKSLKGGDYESCQRHVERIWFKRDKDLDHYLHSASSAVVNYLLEHNVQEFIIGWNNSFKDSINMGRKNNQNFTFIPLAKYRDMLTYKCEAVGIKVIITEESYTSKASFIDNDILPVYDKNSSVKYKFSGCRVSRGVYKSASGVLIHADVNAAWNIMRKCKPSIGWSSGVVVTPEKLVFSY